MKDFFQKHGAKIIVGAALLGTAGIGYVALAANATSGYTPLTSIPLATDGTKGVGLEQYLKNIFQFAIAFSAVLAIFMIIIGGLQYMSTDAISGKRDGMTKVREALFGLLLVILSWIILYTVNPSLVNLKLRIPSPNTPASQAAKSNPLRVTYYEKDANGNIINSESRVFSTPEQCKEAIRVITSYPNTEVKENCVNANTPPPKSPTAGRSYTLSYKASGYDFEYDQYYHTKEACEAAMEMVKKNGATITNPCTPATK